MKLIELIISTLSIRVNDIMFSCFFTPYRSTKGFIFHIYKYVKVIKELQEYYGKELKFALIAENSQSYVAAFLALIIRKVDFYLIPLKMNENHIKSILLTSEINVIFCDGKLRYSMIVNRIYPSPLFKACFDIETVEFVIAKSNFDTVETIDRLKELSNYMNRDEDSLDIDFDSLTDGLDKIRHKIKSRKIAVFSSNSDNVYPKAVYFTDDEIYNALIKLSDSTLLPDIQGQNVISFVDYSIAPVLTILWPLYHNATISFDKEEASVFIMNDYSFESVWRNTTKHVYGYFLIGKLMLRNKLTCLFRFLARKELKKQFNTNKKGSSIIILNSFLSPRILKTIAGKLNLYTTYGIQEANQIVAINNFSTKKHFEENCAGELIEGISAGIKTTLTNMNEGSLVISSDHLSRYLDFEKDIYYDTRDHASLKHLSLNKTLLYVYGKMKYAIRDSAFEGSNTENLERILKNVPYFKDVMILEYENDFYILIYPDVSIVENAKIGLIDFKNFIKPYKVLLNNKYGVDFIKEIKIVFKDFVRTHDGKIKKALYSAALDTEFEDL